MRPVQGAKESLLLLDFFMKRAALKRRIVLELLNLFGLLARIARSHITRGALAFLASFCAFDDNCFSGHNVLLFKIVKAKKMHLFAQKTTLFLQLFGVCPA